MCFGCCPAPLFNSSGKVKGKETAETSFRQFVTESGNGLRTKDKDILDEDVLARVGAARISKWLEIFVLPEQDILVDAPHLVSRYPSLIDGDRKKIGTWNKTAQLVGHYELGLNTESIEPYRFKKDYWISRPAWFWDKLREHGQIQELTEPRLTVKPDWVFCEDASRFYIEWPVGSSLRTPPLPLPDVLPRVSRTSIIGLGFGFRCEFLQETK